MSDQQKINDLANKLLQSKIAQSFLDAKKMAETMLGLDLTPSGKKIDNLDEPNVAAKINKYNTNKKENSNNEYNNTNYNNNLNNNSEQNNKIPIIEKEINKEIEEIEQEDNSEITSNISEKINEEVEEETDIVYEAPQISREDIENEIYSARNKKNS